MQVYRVIWSAFSGVLGMAGIAMASTWSLTTTLVICGFVASWAAAAAMIASPVHAPLLVLWRRIVKYVAVGVTVVLPLVGVGALLGPGLTALLLAFVVGGSPAVIRWAWRWLKQRDQPVDPSPEPDGHSSELSRTWQTSYSALHTASLSQQLQIVESRQHQLDEFERRNPEGFAAWLASEPRATGDPIPFVLGDHDRDLSPINWDGLA